MTEEKVKLPNLVDGIVQAMLYWEQHVAELPPEAITLSKPVDMAKGLFEQWLSRQEFRAECRHYHGKEYELPTLPYFVVAGRLKTAK